MTLPITITVHGMRLYYTQTAMHEYFTIEFKNGLNEEEKEK